MKLKFTIALFLFSFQVLFAQNKGNTTEQYSLTTILQDSLSKSSFYSPEFFYIITDRPWYFPGDEIWCKVHITTSGLPITNSSVLYVDLADSAGKILIRKILPVDDNGASYGTIQLPPTLRKGWYSLNVQTDWNRNFNYGFEKLIYLNDRNGIPQTILFPDELSVRENTVHFFPEGGNFVAGLQNHFVVRTIGKNDKPMPAKGYVLNAGDTIGYFETATNGLGEFTLPPVSDSDLPVVVYWPDGNKTVHFLPEMKSSGAILQATISNKKLFYKIECKPGFLDQESKFLLAAIMHEEIVYSRSFENAKELQSFSDFIPLTKFPGGFISLQLYSDEGKKIAERNIYNSNGKNIIVEKKEIRFEPKGRNEIDIVFPDTVYGTYSISITDADLAQDDPVENLTNDAVQDPAQEPFSLMKMYGKKMNELNLQLSAITQNSSTRTYENFRFPFQQGLDISGKVYYQKTGQPVSGRMMNFFPRNSNLGSFLFSDSLDETGAFRLHNLFLPDSSVLYWNINGVGKKELNKIKLTLNQNWFDSLIARPTCLKMQTAKVIKESNQPAVKTALDKYFSIEDIGNKRSKVLPEVTVYAKQRARLEELDKKYAGTSLFGGRLGNVFAYDLEEEKGHYSTIFTFLRSRVPGLYTLGPSYNPLLLYRAPMGMDSAPKTNVAVFVNEIRYLPPDQIGDIATIPVDQIAYVKVFKPPFSYLLISEPRGMYEPPISLVIVIYLRKEASKIPAGNFGPPSIQSFAVPGFSLPTVFPTPDYSSIKDSETIPDKRITLYWNPELEILNGKAKIVFYNNDFSKRYLIKIEGINELGEVVSFSQVIDK